MTLQDRLILPLYLLVLTLAGCSAPVGGGDDDDDAAVDDDDAVSDDDDATADDDDAANDDDTNTDDDDATPIGPECTSNVQCDDDEVCVSEDCVAASGRTYTLWVDDADVSKTGPDGDWDAFAGAPDMKVLVYLDGVEILATSEAQDTYYPSWFESVEAVLFTDSELVFEAWEEDFDFDDLVCELSIEDPLLFAHDAGAVASCAWITDWNLGAEVRE